MPTHHLPTFAQLRHRWGDTLSDPAERLREKERLVAYLARFGFVIDSADAALHAVTQLPGEEELSAHRCAEGTAVAHASEGWLLLFPHSDQPAR